MNGSKQKDAKERYLTYSIVVRQADKEKGIDEEVVTKKMPKFIDGGPKDFLEWVYHFMQLAATKHWNAEDKYLNTPLLLEGDLRDAFDYEAISDGDVRMEEEFWHTLYAASKVVLPVDYSEKLQEELWEIKKLRPETLAEYSKRFRALARMEKTLARLSENSPMCEDALCRLFQRGLPFEWQNKYDASGPVYSTVAALVPFFERIEQGEQRLHRSSGPHGQERRQHGNNTSRNNGRRSSNSHNRHNQSNRNNGGRHQPRGGYQGRGNNNGNGNNASSNKYCTFHRTTTHNTQDCRALQSNRQQEEHQQVDHQRGRNAQQLGARANNARTQVVSRVQQANSSSDEEYMFVGLKNTPVAPSPPPMRLMIKLEQGKERYRALLDSGCSRSIIRSDFMKELQTKGAKLEDSRVSYTLATGKTPSAGSMVVRFRIPELKRDSVIIHAFEVLPSIPDDMVIGRDIMAALGLVVDFGTGRVQWDGSEMMIKTAEEQQQTSRARGLVEVDDDPADELFAGDATDVKPADLLPQHLEAAMQHCYLKLLEEFYDLYNGRLGRILLPDYVLPLSSDYVPSHAKPYSIARSQEAAARREIQRLLELDVMEQIYDSEAAAPAFFLVKPSGALRLLVDFRRLNRFLRRSPYFVPKIREILLRLDKAKCLSTLDANMGYFARRLAPHSRAFTAFCLPFGKFQFKRLPMGISTAPDGYQACMEKILGDLPFVIVYLDDILIFSENESDHLEHLRIVFSRLRQYDVTLNAAKCHILRESVDYLGFTLTPNGIQPQAKKMEAIQQIAEPRNKKELRRFLGMISYYREMVPNKSALTAQLNRLTSRNVPFVWSPEAAAAFRDIKQSLARNVWLAFPDYSRTFHVFADASGRQIGGVIVQGKRILACFSRSMTDTQRKYSTMEWELLSVVEILKEYRTMLLGFPVTIHTDHNNLLYPQESSLRVKRWKLLLEEYRLAVQYVPGSQNIGADAFSRLRYDYVKQATEDELLSVEEDEVAIDGAVLKKHQLADSTIKEVISRLGQNAADPDYSLRPALGAVLLHFKKRVVVPASLRNDLVELYHSYLLHPGAEKQFRSMATFWWPGMETEVTKYVAACMQCKRAKLHGGKQAYGHLPPTPMTNEDRPFDVVHVDLVGPLQGDYYCLTAIERQFRWLEVIMQHGRTASTTALSFERCWLCRYPRPKLVVHDQGPEFTGEEFHVLLRSMAIKSKPTSTKNPQANAICERVHLEILNIIRARPDLNDQLEVVLDYAAYSIRASYHSVLRASPAQLLFGEDLITRQLHFANWSFLSKQRFAAIMQENDRENLSRIQHFYQVGDQVMLRVPPRDRRKTEEVAKGPFLIKQVYDNRTVLLDKGTTETRVNIRRIFPC